MGSLSLSRQCRPSNPSLINSGPRSPGPGSTVLNVTPSQNTNSFFCDQSQNHRFLSTSMGSSPAPKLSLNLQAPSLGTVVGPLLNYGSTTNNGTVNTNTTSVTPSPSPVAKRPLTPGTPKTMMSISMSKKQVLLTGQYSLPKNRARVFSPHVDIDGPGAMMSTVELSSPQDSRGWR